MATSRKSDLGSIRKLPSGRYQSFYTVDGQRFTAPTTFPTKADARAWLATERADRARGTWSNPNAGRVTLAEYLADWLESRQNLAPSTRALYRDKVTRWVLPPVVGDDGRAVELGRIELAGLTPTHVRRWFAVVSQATRRATIEQVKRSSRAEHPARAWGRDHGFDVARTGRMSPAMVAAWKAAGAPTAPARTRKHGTGPDGRCAGVQGPEGGPQ